MSAVLLWVLQHVTPRRLWARYVVPGVLVVVTTSETAREAIETHLSALSTRRVFRVLEFTQVRRQESGEAPHFRDPLVGLWEVRVARGCERAVVLDLETRVAASLERAGGYRGIDPRVSLVAARRAMAAHQARRLRVASIDLGPPQQISLTPTHAQYLQLLDLGEKPEHGVEVAILDTAVDVANLVPGVVDRFRVGEVSAVVAGFEPSDHGAMTASVIASVAPTSRIEAFPVMEPKGVAPETSIITSLRNTQARVICMCVEFDFPPRKRADNETAIEATLRGLGPDRVVVVASGNRRGRGGEDVGFPARCPTVVAVGAVDSACRRATYSRFRFPQNQARPLYLMAPGGWKTGASAEEFAVRSGQSPMVGTSVAAAYAAGVIARSISLIEGDGARAPTSWVLKALYTRANRDFAGYPTAPLEYGAGVIRCLRANDAPANTRRMWALREQLRLRMEELLASEDVAEIEALARSLDVEVP